MSRGREEEGQHESHDNLLNLGMPAHASAQRRKPQVEIEQAPDISIRHESAVAERSNAPETRKTCRIARYLLLLLQLSLLILLLSQQLLRRKLLPEVLHFATGETLSCEGLARKQGCEPRKLFDTAHAHWLEVRAERMRAAPPLSCSERRQRIFLSDSAYWMHKDRPIFLSRAAVLFHSPHPPEFVDAVPVSAQLRLNVSHQIAQVRECESSCAWTDREENATVVVHGGLKAHAPLVRGQQVAVFNMEAHSHLQPTLFGEDRIPDHHDLLATFRRGAQVPVSYGYGLFVEGVCPGGRRSVRCREQHPAVFSLCDVGAAAAEWQAVWGQRTGPGAQPALPDAASEAGPSASREGARDTLVCALRVFPARVQAIVSAQPRARAPRGLVAAFVSATCDRHGGFLRELMAHISVASYGNCYRNADEEQNAMVMKGLVKELFPNSTASRAARKVAVVSQHRFYLAIENTLTDGYLTEKFFQGLVAPTVMVYMGAPDAVKYTPAPNAFIDATRFPSAKALAEYLKRVDADESLYQSHMRWREQIASPADVNQVFKDLVRHDFTLVDENSMLCRICKAATADCLSGNVSSGVDFQTSRKPTV